MRSLLAIALLLGSAAAADDASPATSLAITEIVTLSPAVEVGESPIGHRRIIPITGGTFSGPGIKGTVLPGGWDWQLNRADGSLIIEADYFIRTDDGVTIKVHNKGVVVRPQGGKPYVRTVPEFEAPQGKYGWLNDTIFVGGLGSAGDKQHPAVKVTIFRVE